VSLGDELTLGEARDWLRGRVAEGDHCPLCTQYAKVYRRTINSTQARALIVIYRECGRDFGYLPDLRMALAPHHSNEEPKLRYWGLLEEEPTVREDGGRAGWWRVTELGERFARHQVRVPSHALIYDGRCLGLRGEPVSISDCLGNRFDYRELMDGI
jgi:hypothetical protein